MPSLVFVTILGLFLLISVQRPLQHYLEGRSSVIQGERANVLDQHPRERQGPIGPLRNVLAMRGIGVPIHTNYYRAELYYLKLFLVTPIL